MSGKAKDKPRPPDFVEVVVSRDAEKKQPTVSNAVSVSGTTDMVNIDFFYVHPKRVSRIEDLGGSSADGERRGDTFYINADPVAQIALPLTTATELLLQTLQTLMFGLPRMQLELNNFGARMGHIMQIATSVQAKAEAGAEHPTGDEAKE